MKVHSRGTLRYKIISFLGKSFISFLEFFVQRFSKEKIVFNNEDFPWVNEVEKNYEAILKEYKTVSEQTVLPDIREISEEQDSVIEKNFWTFFPLYAYGIPIKENLLRCPETVNILDLIPNKTTVFFSVIKPNTFIKPHRGAYKGYLRYHLGIDIPSPTDKCGIKILDKIYNWENGKSIIFDDTYIHEAWNYSERERVVLYVDFIKPMPKILMVVSKFLTWLISRSPFIQNAAVRLNENKLNKKELVVA